MRVRRFAVLAPTVLGLAVAPPVLAQEPPPQTGFEQRVAATPSGAEPVSWTTLDEEAAFLAAVDAGTDRVAVEEVGRSAQGRPLLLVRLGEPAPPGPEAAAGGRVVLFTCSQHGDEPAGREGCLQRLRDLAYSSDPAVAEHLRTTTVLFLSANPDGRAADTRENAQGIDVNRDHLDPVSPEGQLIERLIRDWRPDVVADMHEFSSRPLYDPELLFLWPRNRNVDERVRELSVALSRDYVAAGAEAAGFSTGVYGISVLDGVEVAQDAGDEDERILRNVAGLRGSVGLLVETDTSANRRNPEEADDRIAVQRRRVATHVQAIGDVLRFQREQAPEIEATTEAAGERHAARTGPFYLDGADNRLPSIDDVLYPPPCAYDVTATEAGRLASTFALHGIRSEPRGGDVRVPLAQPAQPLIPLLLDAAAEFAPVTSGRRVASCG
jgi:hypothetical protein